MRILTYYPRRAVLLVCLLLTLWIAYTHYISTAQDVLDEQADVVDDCTEVEYLMARNQTPYDYAIHGGKLEFNAYTDDASAATDGWIGYEAHITETFEQDEWADYWVFRVGDGDTQADTSPDSKLTLDFALSSATDEHIFNLEVALFYGGVYVAEETQAETPSYLPVWDEKQQLSPTRTYSSLEPGIYTLVVRRPHISDTANVGQYDVTLKLAKLLIPEDIGDNFFPERENGSEPVAENILENSRVRVRFNTGAEIYLNAGGVTTFTNRIATRAVNQNGTIYQVDASARTHYTGGGIGSHWQGSEGASTIYIERYNFGAEADSNFLRSSFERVADFLNTDWQGVEGIWILEGCFGFKLRDIDHTGSTFVARTFMGTERAFSINTDFQQTYLERLDTDLRCAELGIVLNAPLGEAEANVATETYSLCLDWTGIEQGAEVRLENGVLHVPLVGERLIEIQSTYIAEFSRTIADLDNDVLEYGLVASLIEEDQDLNRDRGRALANSLYAPQNPSDPLINAPLNIRFQPARQADTQPADDVNFVIDWINIASISYKAVTTDNETPACEGQYCVTIQFSEDDPVRDTTVRNGDNLELFEALDDVIRIVYRDGAERERLMLPLSESYIEIVTPAEEKPKFNGAVFDPNAIPGESGFAPRFANNLGAECYPYTTLHPEANCAANGYPNPANGNIWYSVTDHSAAGQNMNLTLTRNYNSGDANLDSPFGLGWSTEFMLDYNIEYDETTNSRTVTDANVNTYRVGLNLVYAPNDMIIYNTPSGSRHVFTRSNLSADYIETLGINQDNVFVFNNVPLIDDQPIDYYRSLTMPGWVLFRANIRQGWTLYQDDGMQIGFDRAGRIQYYGYPHLNRVAQIGYTTRFVDRIDGPGGYGVSNSVQISDSTSERRLELYFDERHHIYRSVLRDITARPDFRAACDLTDNCHETLYKYDAAGRLIEVIYSNNQTATYTYAPDNRLQTVHDPRAPIAADLEYIFTENRVNLNVGTAKTPFLTAVYNDATTTITDEEYGTRHIYTYNHEDNSAEWNVPGTVFQLEQIEIEAAQAGSTEFEAAQTITYNWQRNAIIQVSFATDDTETRSITYTFGAVGAILGNDQTLVKIVDSDVVRYQALRDDYYVEPGVSYYGHPQVINFEDGTTARLEYSRNEAHPQITRYDAPDGSVNIIARYEDKARLNWINEVDRYYFGTNGTANDLAQLYDYNAVGLVTIYQQQRPTDSAAESYIMNFDYDGLGQLTSLTDTHQNRYSIEHTVLECADSNICREVRVSDALDGVTTYRFDGRNLLREVRLEEGTDGNLLRRTTYEYDDRDRLITETRYANDVDCTTDPIPDDCIITRYSYEKSPAENTCLEQATASIDATSRIRRTNALGQTYIVDYDALGRIVAVIDETELCTTYDYTYATNQTEVNEVRHYHDQAVTTQYTVDDAQRLTDVTYGVDTADVDTAFELNWQFTSASNYNVLSSLKTPSGEWQWDFPTPDQNDANLLVLPSNLTLSTTTQFLTDGEDAIQYNIVGDGLSNIEYLSVAQSETIAGTNQTITTAEGVQVTRCLEAEGALKVIYYRRRSLESVTTSCEVTAGVDAIYYYDVLGRVTGITDEFGTRTFSYEASTTEDHRWNVTMTAISPDETIRLEWRMVYNLAGDLLAWTDDTGVTQRYSYDLLGRLLQVSTDDENDESNIAVAYDGLDNVLSFNAGVNQRYVYEYDPQGRLISRKNIATGVSLHDIYASGAQYTAQIDHVTNNELANEELSYGYDANGQLETIERSIGGVFIERYTYTYDGNNPLLLISVTYSRDSDDEPLEEVHRFQWQIDNGSITGFRGPSLKYTNPLGYDTTYQFGLNGQLGGLIDAQDNRYRWSYNTAGQIEQFVPPSDNAYVFEYAPAFDTHNLLLMAVTANNRYLWREAIERTPTGLLSGRENLGRLEFAYDPLGRLHEITASSQQGEPQYRWAINRESNLANMQFITEDFSASADSLTDMQIGFDPLFRLRSITAAANAVQQYRHVTPFTQRNDATSEQCTASCIRYSRYSADGIERLFVYNEYDRLARVETTLCRSQSDVADCLDAQHKTIELTYTDSLIDNRLIHTMMVDYDDGSSETFDYDTLNNLQSYTITHDNQELIYRYTYDAINRLTRMTTPDGSQIWYWYGETTVDNSLVSTLTICQTLKDVSAATVQECRERGYILAEFTYDALGRISQRDVTGYNRPPYDSNRTPNAQGSSASETVEYSYGNLGGIESVEGANGSVTYTYSNDGLNRIATLNTGANGQQYTFRYEANPNFDPTNLLRLQSIESDEPTASVTYTYDAQGRVATMTVGGHEFTFSYGLDTITVTDSANESLSAIVDDTLNPTAPPIGIVDAIYSETDKTYTSTRSNGALTVTSIYDINLRLLSTFVERSGTEVYSSTFDYDYVPQEADDYLLLQEKIAVRETRTYGNGSAVIDYIVVMPESASEGYVLPEALPLAAQIITLLPEDAQPEAEWAIDTANNPINPYRHWLRYRYDQSGNLVETIYFGSRTGVAASDTNPKLVLSELSCMKFTYDAANRLVEVYDSRTAEPVLLATYTYDVHNRLVAFDSGEEFIYLDGEREPLFMFAASGMGQAMQSSTSETITDYALDGLGRAIPTAGNIEADTGTVENPCTIGNILNASIPASGTLFDSMIFDARTGLAFVDGRAYMPTIGRYLQRDPRGMDINGNVYAYPASRLELPLPQPAQHLGDGLAVLQTAVAMNPLSNPLTAQIISDQHLPALPDVTSGILQSANQQGNRFSMTLQTMLNFPAWMSNYNQPGPQFDVTTGLLSWDTHIVNDAQTPIHDMSGTFWTNQRELNSPIALPGAVLAGLQQYATIGYEAPVLYQAQAWNARTSQSANFWNVPSMSLGQAYQPDSVLSVLLPVWLHPEQNLTLLNLTDAMTEQYLWTGEMWLESTLSAALPYLPDNPNALMDEWDASQFGISSWGTPP